jgi:hypothetical protein
MVAGMTDLFGESGVPFIDMAGNQDEFGKAMISKMAADVRRIRPDAGFAGRPERLAAGRVAEDPRPENRHEHDRRHGPLHPVSGRQRHSRSGENEGGMAGMGVGLGAGLGLGQQMAGAMAGAL